jgi:hypothetical protein
VKVDCLKKSTSALLKLAVQACRWTFVGDSVVLNAPHICRWVHIGQEPGSIFIHGFPYSLQLARGRWITRSRLSYYYSAGNTEGSWFSIAYTVFSIALIVIPAWSIELLNGPGDEPTLSVFHYMISTRKENISGFHALMLIIKCIHIHPRSNNLQIQQPAPWKINSYVSVWLEGYPNVCVLGTAPYKPKSYMQMW